MIGVTFLSPNKKVTKEVGQGALSVVLPHAKDAPLETPVAHLRWLWSTLTYLLFRQKMSRFFARRVTAVQYRFSYRQGGSLS